MPSSMPGSVNSLDSYVSSENGDVDEENVQKMKDRIQSGELSVRRCLEWVLTGGAEPPATKRRRPHEPKPPLTFPKVRGRRPLLLDAEGVRVPVGEAVPGVGALVEVELADFAFTATVRHMHANSPTLRVKCLARRPRLRTGASSPATLPCGQVTRHLGKVQFEVAFDADGDTMTLQAGRDRYQQVEAPKVLSPAKAPKSIAAVPSPSTVGAAGDVDSSTTPFKMDRDIIKPVPRDGAAELKKWRATRNGARLGSPALAAATPSEPASAAPPATEQRQMGGESATPEEKGDLLPPPSRTQAAKTTTTAAATTENELDSSFGSTASDGSESNPFASLNNFLEADMSHNEGLEGT